MKSAILAATLCALGVRASTLERRDPADYDTLNFALTLEHVEVAFYTMGLQNYTQDDFTSAGFPEGTRNQFVEILEHESAHVAFLENLLGDRAVQPCAAYKFPVDTPKSFAGLSQVIENVGTGAYTGAISTLSQQYITGSASILGTEARQAALLAAYVNNVEGWGNAFNIPLTKNQAFTLASPFIVSCDQADLPVGVHANPPLTFPSNANPGDTVTVQFTSNTNADLYAVFLFGLDQIVVPVQNGEVTIPQNLAGQVYAIISTSSTGVTDDTTVAGPAVLQFEFTLTGDYIPNQ